MRLRKGISGMLAVCMTLSILGIPALAVSTSDDNILFDGTKIEDNAIVLRNMDDVESMNRADEREYAEKLDKIDPQIKKAFEEFDGTINSNLVQSFVIDSNNAPISDEEYIESFLNAHPEYRNANVNSDIMTLRNDAVVTAVREYFRIRGFQLSLALFNHSLTSNPEKAYLDLIGNTDGMYAQIKRELNAYDFVKQMVAFSRAGNNQQTISNSSDYVFWDTRSDMYWSIHGFTWTRTRVAYDKAYFKIIDVYDFLKGPGKDIPGMVASWAGTNDFDVEIYGLVQNGVLK